MPYAVTHILIAIILVELFREFFIKDNKKFPRYYILIAAFGAIIPDLDFIFVYLLNPLGFTINQIHRTILHTIFIPIILLLCGAISWKLKLKNKQFGKKHLHLPTIFFLLAIMNTLHLILDALFSGQITPLYPFLDYTIGLWLVTFLPEELQQIIFQTIDGILLLFWIIWMEFKIKITSYF